MKISELGDKWFEAYIHCLNNYKVTEAASIAYHYRPKRIYRYYSFSSKHWRENVYDSQIPFNSPSNYNDPLDSRWFLDFEKIIAERFKADGEPWDREEFGGDEFFDNAIELYEEDMLYLRYMFCSCCFSSSPHSNLMWGHYSDKHKGFCIEYDVSCFPEELQLIMPVVYTASPFDASKIIDMVGIDDKYATLCPLLFKSKDWSYEKEWRCIIPDNDYKMPYIKDVPGTISGIYLGFNSYGKERDELINWANNNSIPVYQIERSYLSYDFISEPISEMKSNRTHIGLLI